MTTDNTTVRRDFTLTWKLDASPAEVFRAWTDPKQLEWYYNDRQPMPTEPIELDLSVGGRWRQVMVIDETTSFVTGGIYREIVRDEKLVFAWGAVDGWPKLDPESLDDAPHVTVTLHEAEADGGTEMTVHVELPASLSEDDVREWFSIGVREGWRDTVDRLAAALARAASAA
jgi:uncharacterized protein YndB with AHSA1/START domain